MKGGGDKGVAARPVALTATVPDDLSPGTRIDRWCAEVFIEVPSRAFARKLIKKDLILLEGQLVESSRVLLPGQVVTLLAIGRPPPSRPFELELAVHFEDEHMAVVSKPAGVLTNGARFRTLEHALPGNLAPSSQADVLPAPRPVHRLDFQTSGLVVCAKTASAMVELGRSFQERRVRKTYRAVLLGRLEGEGRVDSPVEGRSAASTYKVLGHTRSLSPGWLTTVELSPLTGRTHQLRRHMAELGTPVLGDALYTRGKVLKKAGLFLCAVQLELDHPITGEPLSVRRDEPTKFEAQRQREQRRWDRWESKTMRRDHVRRLLNDLDAHDAEEADFKARMLALSEVGGDPFSRDHFTPGHFTASSFLLSPSGDELLLIFHSKLKRWLQPGGHVDPEDGDILVAARREIAEEVGITDLELVGEGAFDADVHVIPAHKGQPSHEHHDLRFLFRARSRDFQAGSDAEAARWVRLEDINAVESDRSVMRAVEKLLSRR